MKNTLLLIMVALLLATLCSMASAELTGKAGKYTVTVNSTPTSLVAGDNNLTITVKDGGKPVEGGGVSIHADMTSMSMPADFKAKPGKEPGEYTSTVTLGMEGEWKITIKVQQMDGMTMDGDGQADFTVNAVKSKETVPPPYTPPPGIPIQPTPDYTPYIVGGAVFLLIIVIIGFVLGKKGNNK